jgi:Uma2 family endonuclease
MGAPLTIPRVTITVDQFHRMGEAGIFRDNEHVELVEGEMIQMPPIGPAHASRVNVVGTLFARRLDDDRALVSYQNPITLPPKNEPQPDIALLKPATHRYKTTLPLASDVLLVVEVADTTLSYDRDVKIPIYAQNGIAEVWLFDVQTELLIVFRAPVSGVYTSVFTLQQTESIAPLLLSDVTISLVDLWR